MSYVPNSLTATTTENHLCKLRSRFMITLNDKITINAKM